MARWAYRRRGKPWPGPSRDAEALRDSAHRLGPAAVSKACQVKTWWVVQYLRMSAPHAERLVYLENLSRLVKA